MMDLLNLRCWGTIIQIKLCYIFITLSRCAHFIFLLHTSNYQKHKSQTYFAVTKAEDKVLQTSCQVKKQKSKNCQTDKRH